MSDLTSPDWPPFPGYPRVGGGADEGPVGGDAKLAALQSAVNGAIDDLADDETGGAAPPLPGSGSGEAEAEGESPTPPAEEPPSEAGAEPGESPSPTPEGEPNLIEQRLASMSKEERDAVQKFLPGGQAATMEQLDEARGRVFQDYWRNHERLAELSRTPPPAPEAEAAPTPAAPAAVPPELSFFDNQLQALNESGVECNQHIAGWQQERNKINGQISQLLSRQARQDPSVDPAEVVQLYGLRDQAEANILQWRNRFNLLDQQFRSITHQRSITEAVLDTRSRIERQESEARTNAENQAITQFSTSWTRAFRQAAADVQIPKEDLEKFRVRARDATHYRVATQGAIPEGELPAYIKSLAQEFKGEATAAAAQGAAGYAKRKAGDAPKAPKQKQRYAGGPPPATPQKERPSMRELSARVNSDPGWDNL